MSKKWVRLNALDNDLKFNDKHYEFNGNYTTEKDDYGNFIIHKQSVAGAVIDHEVLKYYSSD